MSFVLRAQPTTWHPRSARRWLIAHPIPLVAPVTNTHLFFTRFPFQGSSTHGKTTPKCTPCRRGLGNNFCHPGRTAAQQHVAYGARRLANDSPGTEIDRAS